ncbi:MAG: outer membrane protein assembly factor BamA [Sulfurimonas sp. RIFCSPHIGHO2_12_FULL_36_9]|uniref:outer membrane protein assembly factor BamA n=1 Tax=Sulfurimonas sp. RIFCSPLOWO2_12_36_12 TaxID=1802253 RepID=UPI0008BD797F|nr:outer membrane protein assembly factor BamA [Sulfurimonas sp. RIFCSPLOWO2_12_36_12]OHD96875.1 MAG: outer membrane protein assembly factor BamA [Sulfurimonas sp. RIFCSPHIGHO2_12_FULL_36_9]OHD99151.1 MAG: outer membrane protein assembly factor BamA [Sulfurimonas sp. RIFCSPLOWO2_02_FULL_36_28]OHE00020.1 MAG: outer membrane protein assembly factor BamA [Sulfurimonas sp. RIFCSPLOWO2_12_36_12]OHE07324.1 MAG: outer membrane protein assembly factor BamA [Sulfurimonas sp. RIFCSPLOWO2_12_FULL_36_74]
MRIFLAILLTLIAVNSFAYTIKTIKYEGMVQMSESVALRMLKFDIGDTVDDKMLDASIKTYYKQGYFEDIWIDIKEDGALTFHFKEKPLISKIELKGWKEDDSETMDSVIQIKVGSQYDEKKLEAAKKRIIEAINQEAKIDSVVEISKELLDNGSYKVTFLVNEGEEIIIEELLYSGAVGLKSDEFDSMIANKEREFMGWFWGRNDGKMKVADLAYDPLRIRDLYMQHGYLDIDVKEPFVKVNFDNYTAEMSYQIKEGEVYTISGISIEQEKHVVDDALIKELIKLKTGKAFNVQTFREDSQRIKTLIADLSYAFVQIVPDLKKNKEKKEVEVVFKIMPGEKVKIRNVVISGNSRTLDRIVRRELYLGPGDMYSLTDLSDSRNALGRLGFFDGNTIEEKRIDGKTMDLVVKVKEAPTGNIQLGGGYGSYGGLLVSVAVDDRNVWGSGIDVGVKAERSSLTSNYSFTISNPRLNDSDFSGNFSVYTSDYEYNDYSVLSDGFTTGIGHRFTRYISGHVGYGFSANSYDIKEDANLTGVAAYLFENYTKSSVTLSAKYDNTDDFYLPRKGFMLSQSIEKAGIGADANFVKFRTNFGAFKGLEEYVGFDLIARYKARFYYAKETGYLPEAERFYMGGIGSVRGYESYSLSPKTAEDVNATDGIRRYGGEYTASNSFELSFPLVPKAKMRLVTYLDWGVIGTSEESTVDYTVKDVSRGGFGAGLEWFSPVGPIQLMFSKPLAEEEGDKTAVFEFTMGQRF